MSFGIIGLALESLFVGRKSVRFPTQFLFGRALVKVRCGRVWRKTLRLLKPVQGLGWLCTFEKRDSIVNKFRTLREVSTLPMQLAHVTHLGSSFSPLTLNLEYDSQGVFGTLEIRIDLKRMLQRV